MMADWHHWHTLEMLRREIDNVFTRQTPVVRRCSARRFCLAAPPGVPH